MAARSKIDIKLYIFGAHGVIKLIVILALRGPNDRCNIPIQKVYVTICHISLVDGQTLAERGARGNVYDLFCIGALAVGLGETYHNMYVLY